MADPQKDLDAFLTSVESKLRAPFSSLDFAKTVTASALRSSLTPQEYLDRTSQTIARTDKVIQMRVLIGLLGLEPSKETDAEIDKILTQTQEAPLYEEWVRVIAGLVEGIVFVDKDGKSCRGKEASALLQRTCQEIIKQVRTLEDETTQQVDADPSLLTTADVDPTFAPYRYALLNSDLRDRVIPDLKSHAHFQVNDEADILTMDAKLEQAKAQEEQEHAKQAGVSKAANGKTARKSNNDSKDVGATIFPGFRPTKPAAKTTPGAAAKSSMFMPKKKPGMARGTLSASKTSLHVRKAGASQALVGKGRRARLQTGSTAASGTTSLGGRGRAGKFSNARSKMKMIDVTEVQDLKKEKEQKGEDKKVAGVKRKAEPSAAGKVAKAKKEEANGDTSKAESGTKQTAQTSKTEANALASAALSAYQAQMAGTQQAAAPTAAAAAPAAPSPAKQQDWRQMLKEKSNRLSDEDRYRIQQFYLDRYNPTPDQPTYKMKLHEERRNDPKTGEPVKETFYLELDYTDFTSKQSKKTKRYKDGNH